MGKNKKNSAKQEQMGNQQQSSGSLFSGFKNFFTRSNNDSKFSNGTSGTPALNSGTSVSQYSNPSMGPTPERRIDPLEEMRINEMKRQQEHEERMRALREQMNEDEERAEREYQEDRITKQREAQERKRKMLEEEEREQREHDEQFRIKQENDRIEREQEQEKIREEAYKRAVLDEKAHQQEIETLHQEGAQQMREIREERERKMEDFDKTMLEQNQQFAEAEMRETEEARIRKEEFERAQEEHEMRKQKMLEELEKKKEEMHQRHRERMDQLRDQWEQIRQALQYKIWNDVIERNWTNRLNTLRSSNQEVRNLYEQMKNHPSQDSSLVLVAIENQKTLMKNEGTEMEKMHNETRKQFLLVIKEAVEEVVSECDRLIYVLKNEPTNINRIEECFSALSRSSIAIPTLAELKHNHN